MAGSRCKMCQHPQVIEINKALSRPGVSVKSVAETFALDRTTLWRHSKRCVSASIAKALLKQQVITGASLVSDACGIRATVVATLQQSAENGKHELIAPLTGAYVKTSEHIARLSGVEGYRQVQAAPIAIDARGSRFLIMPVPAQVPEFAVLALPEAGD